MDRLNVVLEFTFGLELHVAAGAARLGGTGLALALHGPQVLGLAQARSTGAGSDVDAGAGALTEAHAARAQAVGQAVDVQFHQILLGTEFFEAGRALVQFGDVRATARGLGRGPVACLLHVEGPVDFELQGGGDRLHADHAAEPRQGVPQVGVHLAVFQELLLTLQRHLADAAVPRVQALTVRDLVFGQGQERGEALPTDGAHVMFHGAQVRLHVLPEAVLREEGPRAHGTLVVPFDELGFLLDDGALPRPDVVVPELMVLQQRLHGVGRPADVAAVHGLRGVHVLLAAVVAVVGLLAVGQQGLQLHLLLLARLRGPVGAAVGRLGVEHAVLLPQVLLQQDDGVEGLAAELAVVLLAVRGDVALQLHLGAEGLAAEDALVHFALVLQVVVLHVQLQVRLVAEVPVAGGAAIHFLLVTVLHGQVELDGDLGVEHLLAEGAAEEDEGVHVQQVFLQVVHRRELLVTALADVVRGGDHEMDGHVLQQGLLIGELLVALRTGQFRKHGVQVGLQVSLKAVQGRVLSTTLITDIFSGLPCRRPSYRLHHLQRCLLYGHR